jgi:4-cresol dehydrogenase (hydroxylating)
MPLWTIARAPIELMIGLFRLLVGSLAPEVEACLGDTEERIKAQKMWDFFHVPTIIAHGVVPYVPPDSYPFPSYDRQARYPSGFLCSDISLPRLDAIEHALSQPGRQGVAELFALKADRLTVQSSLEPEGGLGALTDAAMPQRGVPMDARLELRELGEWLRKTDAFKSLSSAEAAVLGMLMERRTAVAGDFVIRRGEIGEELFLIEAGRAEVRGLDGQPLTTLGPGSHLGEIALLEGGERTADVLALEPMSLLRLSREAYTQYLSREAEVGHQLARSALSALQRSQRAHRPAAPERTASDCAARLREVLPADAVIDDPSDIERRYLHNVTALARRVPLVLRPCEEKEVASIVAVANAHRVPLYPFSTGKNWGLGSKLPVVDGCVLVDLSRMDRIVEVSDPFAYAILEPGVTQAQLADHLAEQHPALTLNFTGSFGHTSIVGNVLERGDGAWARADDLLGVRGILGDGTPFQVGGLWERVGSGDPSHHSRFTAGPDLVGMFGQSSFGIVTQMAFRLIRKPERCYLFWGIAEDDRLERVIDTLAHFAAQGTVNRGSSNVGYANRFVQAERSLSEAGGIAIPDPEPWNLYVVVPGTAPSADAAVDQLAKAFEPLCTSSGAFRADTGADPYAALPQFLHPLVKPLLGSPDMESIKLIYQLTGTSLPADPLALDPDETPFGMKCYIPIVPPRGEDARRCARIVEEIRDRFALNVKLSFFGDGRTLITIHFRSDDAEQVQRAEHCEKALWDAMATAGFPPYRASIDQMQRLVEQRPAFFDLVARLKMALDPNGIISPGRYSRHRDCASRSDAPHGLAL